MPSWLANIRDRVRFSFASGEAFILLLMIMVGGAFFAWETMMPPNYGQLHREGTHISGKITRIIAAGGKYAPYGRIVTVRDTSGLEHYVSVPVDMIPGCKIGSTVRVVQSAAEFTLEADPCRSQSKS